MPFVRPRTRPASLVGKMCTVYPFHASRVKPPLNLHPLPLLNLAGILPLPTQSNPQGVLPFNATLIREELHSRRFGKGRQSKKEAMESLEEVWNSRISTTPPDNTLILGDKMSGLGPTQPSNSRPPDQNSNLDYPFNSM